MKAFKSTSGEVTRETFVRFAGVVGDFNPIHYDEDSARKAGLPSVISQGPLTIAMALDAALAANGGKGIGGIRARLTGPVVPHTRLEVHCQEDGSFTVSNGEADVLVGTFDGEAT